LVCGGSVDQDRPSQHLKHSTTEQRMGKRLNEPTQTDSRNRNRAQPK
ncbi:hypothetical protein V6N11_066608, partial [Hibiscus sabdariffa]